MEDQVVAPEVVAEQPADKPPVPADNVEGYYRRQAEKAQRELEALRKSQMTEAERVKLERDEAIQRATAAEERANSTLMQARFEAAARAAGVSDDGLDLAFMAADRNLLRVEDGKVIGVKQALEKLQKERPILFGQAQSQRRHPAGGNPPGGAVTGTTSQKVNDWIRGHR